MQKYPVIQDGDLVDYLDGVLSPALVEAVDASPEHLQKLSQLRQIDHQLKDVFNRVRLLDPQDLIDVAADQATPNQRLIVAAYCRRSPEVAAEFAALKQIWDGETLSTDKQKISWMELFPLFQAKLITAGLGVKGASHPQQTYEVAELQVKAIVHSIPPEEDDFWTLKGQVTQDNRPLPDANVLLSGDHMADITTMTDSLGFFTFEELAEGTCHISISVPKNMISFPAITLDDELDSFL